MTDVQELLKYLPDRPSDVPGRNIDTRVRWLIKRLADGVAGVPVGYSTDDFKEIEPLEKWEKLRLFPNIGAKSVALMVLAISRWRSDVTASSISPWFEFAL